MQTWSHLGARGARATAPPPRGGRRRVMMRVEAGTPPASLRLTAHRVSNDSLCQWGWCRPTYCPPSVGPREMCRSVLVAAFAAACSAQTPPSSAPYKPGASTETGWTWECTWLHDVSTVQVMNLGCAGSVPKTQKNEGPHVSAEACEKWCCENTHLKLGPAVDGGKEAIATDDSTDPPCDFWQWADLKSGPNFGCWVAATDFATSTTQGAKPDWIGAQGCTRPLADWGVTFIVAFLGFGSAYLLGGAAYMRSTGQHGWLVHRHFWDEMGGLVEDGMAFSRGERSGYGRVRPHSSPNPKKKRSSSKGRFAGGRGAGDY